MFTFILFIARKLFPQYADRIRSAKRIIKAVELGALLFLIGVVGSMVIWFSGHQAAAWGVLFTGIAGAVAIALWVYRSGQKLYRGVSADVRSAGDRARTGISRIQSTNAWDNSPFRSLLEPETPALTRLPRRYNDGLPEEPWDLNRP